MMAPTKKRKKGPKGEEWAEVESKIRHLRTIGLTYPEVKEVMSWIYHFKAPLSTYQRKCIGIDSDERHRARKTPEASYELLAMFIHPESFRMKTTIDRPICFERYRTQEEIVHYVDWFVDHLLSRRVARYWTMGNSGFIKIQDKTKRILYVEESQWQLLADRCYDASTLVQARECAKADVTLNLLLEDIGNKAKLEDPYLMFKIWRICRMLRGIEARHPSHRPILKDFFFALKKAASQFGTKSHPLPQLVELLDKVEADDFQDTLRLGSYKTITTFTQNLDKDTPIVLNMWTHHFSVWDKGRCDSHLLPRLRKLCTTTVNGQRQPKYLWSLPAEQFEDKCITGGQAYEREIQNYKDFVEAGKAPDIIPEACVPICFYYTYAYQSFGEKPSLTNYLAQNLCDTTRGLVKEGTEARWSLATQAYAFGAKSVAMRYRKQQDMEPSTTPKDMEHGTTTKDMEEASIAKESARAMAHAYLDEAICRLEFGDRECQTRAAMLSDLNDRWLRKWNCKGADDERKRHKRIVARIEGRLQEASLSGAV